MNGPLYMQSGSNVVLVRRRKQKDMSTSTRLAHWFMDNQIGRRLHAHPCPHAVPAARILCMMRHPATAEAWRHEILPLGGCCSSITLFRHWDVC